MAAAMSADCLISPEPLLEQFNCPICLNTMKDVWVTLCFHRFCENCIKESVNTLHRCPLCNKQLQQEHVQRDAQFNNMLETINREIQNAEARKAASFADQVVNQIGDGSVRLILEELFRDTLVTSLANHLTSENDMRSRYKRKKVEIETAFDRSINELKEKKLSPDEYKKQLEKKKNEYLATMKALDEEIRNVQVLFIEAYKNHLKEHVSNFAAVSTQVRITIWKEDHLFMNKDRQYLEKRLRPEDRLEVLLSELNEIAQLRDDKVAKIGDTVLFTCISPFEDQSEKTVIERLKRMNDDEDNDDVDSLLTVSRNCRPILEHKLLRGSLIIIHGDVMLESEVPKQCFVQVFNENPTAEHFVDYFECKRCARNGQPLRWICRSCASVCHKNHELTPLIFKNKATGPKCDCRKRNCQILHRA